MRWSRLEVNETGTQNGTRSHTFSVLVDNETGVLHRVVGLFSGRGYNIDSLTVSEVDPESGYSKITIVTSGSESVINQIRSAALPCASSKGLGFDY